MLASIERYQVTDSFFGPPYVDVDEQRAAPVPHRYVHGGFEGASTRFSFCFPATFEGRFFQSFEGGEGGHEDTSAIYPGGLGPGLPYAAARGGYLVESNQGHIGSRRCPKAGDDTTIYAYRASAESARFSRHLAAEIYGRPPRYGYAHGISGGGLRSLRAMENVVDVWDGAVPCVPGDGLCLALWSAMANTKRVLGPSLGQVVDAVEPGGSGDPFAGLDFEQRQALAHVYRMGLQRGAEYSLMSGFSAADGVWAQYAGDIVASERDYFERFWSAPGYAGGGGLLDTAVIEHRTRVVRVITAAELFQTGTLGGLAGMMLMRKPELPAAVALGAVPKLSPVGARISLTSGAASGRQLTCTGLAGDILIGGGAPGGNGDLLFSDVKPGDEILIENRDFLAFCFYSYHHMLDQVSFDHLRACGQPIYPQHPYFLDFSPFMGGKEKSGKLLENRKVILLQNVQDTSGFALGGVHYAKMVRAHLGERSEEQFRLWLIDNAEHVPGSMLPGGPPAVSTRLIDYVGVLEQARDELIAWVEQGVTPSGSTGFELGADTAIRLAPTAAARLGGQPVVTATANGAVRAEVKVGEAVIFEAVAEAAPGTGSIVLVEWDFEGTGAWLFCDPSVDGASACVRSTAKHSYMAPGVYFPAVRVASHRAGDVNAVFSKSPNLARVCVVAS